MLFKRKRLMPKMTPWEAMLTVRGRAWFHNRIVPMNDLRRIVTHDQG